MPARKTGRREMPKFRLTTVDGNTVNFELDAGSAGHIAAELKGNGYVVGTETITKPGTQPKKRPIVVMANGVISIQPVD